MPSTKTVLNSFSYFFLDTLIVTTVDGAVWKRLGKLQGEQSGLPELRSLETQWYFPSAGIHWANHRKVGGCPSSLRQDKKTLHKTQTLCNMTYITSI